MRPERDIPNMEMPPLGVSTHAEPTFPAAHAEPTRIPSGAVAPDPGVLAEMLQPDVAVDRSPMRPLVDLDRATWRGLAEQSMPRLRVAEVTINVAGLESVHVGSWDAAKAACGRLGASLDGNPVNVAVQWRSAFVAPQHASFQFPGDEVRTRGVDECVASLLEAVSRGHSNDKAKSQTLLALCDLGVERYRSLDGAHCLSELWPAYAMKEAIERTSGVDGAQQVADVLQRDFQGIALAQGGVPFSLGPWSVETIQWEPDNAVTVGIRLPPSPWGTPSSDRVALQGVVDGASVLAAAGRGADLGFSLDPFEVKSLQTWFRDGCPDGRLASLELHAPGGAGPERERNLRAVVEAVPSVMLDLLRLDEDIASGKCTLQPHVHSMLRSAMAQAGLPSLLPSGR